MKKSVIVNLLIVLAAALLLFAGCGEVEENNNKITEKPVEVSATPESSLTPDETDLPEATSLPVETEKASEETDVGTSEPTGETPAAETIKPLPSDDLGGEEEQPTTAPAKTNVPEGTNNPSTTEVPEVTNAPLATEKPTPEPEPTTYISYEEGKGKVIHFPPIPLR